MKTLQEANLSNVKKALVRADLDVPISAQEEISETYRLDALLPTFNYLLGKGVHPIIMGHIGRPGGEVVPALSTTKLQSFFDSQLGAGSYTLLENLRFDSRENAVNKAFAQELAGKADIYVNESFATCHRETTSITLLPKLLPSYAGIRLSEEVDVLSKILGTTSSPKVAVIGGVKESKKAAIYALAKLFDHVLVVGKLQKTPEDPDLENVKFPVDYSGNGLDIGPATTEAYSKVLFDAKTVVWAGPAGAYDQGYFEGSRQIAKAITLSKAYSVVGGGDTTACLNKLDMLDEFDFVSTAGGAMLAFLSGEKLPGLQALSYYA